jgi:hypothetical protein
MTGNSAEDQIRALDVPWDGKFQASAGDYIIQ